ncbi:trypsin-like serine peptidase [Nonomuraea muscovyensis]
MKRILLPAGGAVLATGLLAAGLAGTAQAQSDVSSDVLNSEAKAVETVEFWSASNYLALKQAVAFNPDSLEVSKIQSGGGYSSDTKPGEAKPIGEEKKVVAKTQNVNFPKTIGKVFFVAKDGKPYWCSGTSIQSQYRNLVATAGHCVYDIAGNDEVVSNWVFVPGYYQGKAPWGIYAGKQAFTHYDFDVYEDFDRDYAFVTVYNGIGGSAYTSKKVSWEEYKAYNGPKEVKEVEVTKDEYTKGKLDPKTTEYYEVDPGSAAEPTGPDYPGAVVERDEVKKAKYDAAPVGKGNGYKFGEPITEVVTEAEYKAYSGPGTKAKDAAGNHTITHYYVQQWYKPGKVERYIRLDPFIVGHVLKDAGRLGDNVGGQGVAWNQKGGTAVRTFGYPFGPHPDGNKPFTGVTPKWCYGKTQEKVLKIPARRVEEHQSFRCAVTAGYDGGPWLTRYSNGKRLGYVTGVTSLIVDTDNNKRYDTITSALFDGETASIYKAAAAVWSGKLIK